MSALYLVFRGTWSKADILRDLCVEPESHNGALFHGGFLGGVRDDPVLHSTLKRVLAQAPLVPLYVIGHSLGGSLAMTLIEAGLLPAVYSGPVTSIGIGSPPVRLSRPGRPPLGTRYPVPFTDDESEGQHSQPKKPPSTPLAMARPSPRHLLIVNDRDVVPRLLGSPMPLGTASLLAQGGGPVLRRNLELMRTMQSYCHPHTTTGLLLRDDEARAVPSVALPAVLHLHEAISSSLIDQHGVQEYISRLELAAALAEADSDSDADMPVDGHG
jgi:pimeloyl-ACP methyl ester carboxylesterase